MGSKNNPKNRGNAEKKKIVDGKEVEPIEFYDPEAKKNYLGAKFSKTTDIVCDKDGVPLRWGDISDNS
ncbi:MAG: hypothetical protein LBB09_00940 [Rickettsiales bacterium]|jgi:hypothetical protein|nr:hypothetical protein [Rickettsiales bacterium]